MFTLGEFETPNAFRKRDFIPPFSCALGSARLVRVDEALKPALTVAVASAVASDLAPSSSLSLCGTADNGEVLARS